MREVFLSACPSQSVGCVAELESALDMEKWKLQSLPGLVTKNGTLRTDVSCPRAYRKTLGREKKEMVMLDQEVRHLMRNGEMRQDCAETQRRQYMKLGNNTRDKEMLATTETACLNGLTHELAIV